MSDRANDDSALFHGVQNAIVADARRPRSMQATDEALAHLLGFQRDHVERLNDRFTYSLRQRAQVLFRPSS